MKALSLAAAAALAATLATAPATASDLCDVAEADRQPMETLEQKLVAEGWDVKKIKVDDGCYEAYATNAEGQRVEAYFDPQTFALVKTEID